MKHHHFNHDAFVSWTEDDTTRFGHVIGATLEGLTVRTSNGRIINIPTGIPSPAVRADAQPTPAVTIADLVEVPDPSRKHDQERADIHSELTLQYGRHSEDHEVQRELDRRLLARSAQVPGGRSSVPSIPLNPQE
jgi:hypothetical protein